ncbi:MAG: hypothetical protein ACXVB9_01480 [Bdellovibrionota bacterium]
MKKFKILGIYRNPKFSNNAIEVDRLILEQSISELRAQTGHSLEIDMIEETEAPLARGTYDLVLTMAQAEETLKAIDQNFGSSPVWNSPAAIRNCYRKAMSRILTSLNVGYVPYQILSTSLEAPKIPDGSSYWLKRSDFHAISDDDVTLAESQAELELKLARFSARGVTEVILQRHIHGDIYKFYGVRGKFFRAIKVRDFLKATTAPDVGGLEKDSFAAAEALGLQIFGGDAILDSEGRFHFIDLNDWPSFRICRDDAARAVGALARDFLERGVTERASAAVATARA